MNKVRLESDRSERYAGFVEARLEDEGFAFDPGVRKLTFPRTVQNPGAIQPIRLDRGQARSELHARMSPELQGLSNRDVVFLWNQPKVVCAPRRE